MGPRRTKPKDGWLRVMSDGASRGNPGPAGAGAVILDPTGAVLREVSEYLGELTNNQAEYRALILALGAVREFEPDGVEVLSDSELIVRQLAGEYRVRSPELRPLWEETCELLHAIGRFGLFHIPRLDNRRADTLANRAIDEYLSGGPSERRGRPAQGGEESPSSTGHDAG